MQKIESVMLDILGGQQGNQCLVDSCIGLSKRSKLLEVLVSGFKHDSTKNTVASLWLKEVITEMSSRRSDFITSSRKRLNNVRRRA